MKPFDNYECEGQLSIFDIDPPKNDPEQPQKCCGVIPWLCVTKCCHWDANKPQTYKMYYRCPKCNKVPADNTGWTDSAHGTYDKAKAKALTTWNNPIATRCIEAEGCDYIQIGVFDEEAHELWRQLYNEEYDDYYKRKVELSNKRYHEKHKTGAE